MRLVYVFACWLFLSLVPLQAQDKLSPSPEWLRLQVQSAPLKLRFNGTTAEDARRWQVQFRTKLRELLKSPAAPTTWKTHVVSSEQLADHRRDELILWHADHPPLPIFLLVPNNPKGKMPGVVALHGHGPNGNLPIVGLDRQGGDVVQREDGYDYGLQFVRRGFVVIAPCMVPFGPRLAAKGEPKTDPCAETFVRMQALGKILIAENLRDSLWCVEFLARHELVDSERLACVGLSYGGRMTMLTAAMEPRIKVAIVSGALNVFQERLSQPYTCGAQIIPGILEWGDVPEIASLIAPRLAIWETGEKDALIKEPFADEAFQKIQKIYRAFGTEENVIRVRHAGNHVWDGRTSIPLMEKHWAR